MLFKKAPTVFFYCILSICSLSAKQVAVEDFATFTAPDTFHSRQPWRPVQEQITNKVVQIIAHSIEYNILEPYASPDQGESRGSGFFIDNQGHIITNAHVINQALKVWILIPSLGKCMVPVDILGVSVDWDLALLKIQDDVIDEVRELLGGDIPFLSLGDSDTVHRMDEVLALGFPLGHESLKSTAGHINGRFDHLIQMSAPINPGSSGGPCLNIKGEVIGINSAGVEKAQNVGLIIPINDLKNILSDLFTQKTVKRAFLGVISSFATEAQTQYLSNPIPGGMYVAEVVINSPLEKAGVKPGDMIYEINGHRVDIFGEMSVPWNKEDKIDLANFVGRLSVGDTVNLVVYRKGERLELHTCFEHVENKGVPTLYNSHETIDYEIFGGIVVMNLTTNHVGLLMEYASGLSRYGNIKNQQDPVLFISHIFPGSQFAQARALRPGYIINSVNNIPVKTVNDFRDALRASIESEFVSLIVSDTIQNSSDNIMVVVPFKTTLEEEYSLSQHYRYTISEFMKQLISSL